MFCNMYLPCLDLLMHVEEELTTSVLPDNIDRSTEGVDQVPMPVVKVDAYIFSPVGYTMFRFKIGSRVVTWYCYWHLEIYELYDHSSI